MGLSGRIHVKITNNFYRFRFLCEELNAPNETSPARVGHNTHFNVSLLINNHNNLGPIRIISSADASNVELGPVGTQDQEGRPHPTKIESSVTKSKFKGAHFRVNGI